MEKCLILFDIDETLYSNDSKEIPQSTLVALRYLQQAGHILAIATGRAPFELIEMVKDLPFDFFILANGQVVMRDGEIVYEKALDQSIIDELLEVANSTGVYLGFSSVSHSSVTGITPELEAAFSKYYATMPRVESCTDGHESVHQIWYLSEDITAVSERFAGRLNFFPWLNNGADVVPIGVSKAAGLTAALAMIDDVMFEKVVFFGDGQNDLELVKMADIGIAMGNAVPLLKEYADFVTKDINNDGIYYACEQLGLFEPVISNDDIYLRLAELLALVDEEPDELQHYFELKAVYSGYLRDSKMAIKTLEMALIRFPDSIELLIELAATYEFEIQDLIQAKKYYKLVLAIDPNHYLAHDALEVISQRNIH